jgi:cell division protein FtsQ
MTVNWEKALKIAKATLLAGVLFGSIGFVEKQYSSRSCKAIKVNIDNQFENYFINTEDVIGLMTNRGEVRIVGASFEDLNLKLLEQDLYESKFIKKAEVYKSISGSLMVDIDQRRPIARLVSDKLSDRYISSEGKVLPLSKRFTARVALISGSYADQMNLHELSGSTYGEQLLQMLQFIDADAFWKAQVAQLDIDKKGNIKIYTQVSKQVLDFGQPVDVREKFRNLKVFYKEILPAKGWNSYKIVRVKFKNQIVCE